MYLLASVRDERYAFPVEVVREVARTLEVTVVPGAPAAVRGVHNLRGEVLPVIELAIFLGLGGGEAPSVVVAEHDGRRVGLAVDELLDVAELPAATNGAEGPLLGTTVVDGRLVGVIDVGTILDALQAAGGR